MMENTTRDFEFEGEGSGISGQVERFLGTPAKTSNQGYIQKRDEESNADILTFELDDTASPNQSYDFSHYKDFIAVSESETIRSYYFSPSNDERALIIRVKSVEWLRVGKNGHVLVMADGTVLFIPYGWVAMSYEPAVPGLVRYMKF